MRALLLILCALPLQTALGQEEVPEPLPPPPMPQTPPPAAEGEVELEPQVTIIQKEREVIEEYRINNQLYMVKIIPSRGLPYFLVDTDGDGSLETRRNELDNPEVPQWVLFSW